MSDGLDAGLAASTYLGVTGHMKVAIDEVLRGPEAGNNSDAVGYPPNLLSHRWATPLLCPKFVYVVQTLNLARFPSVHTARRFLCLSMAAMTSPEKGRCVFSLSQSASNRSTVSFAVEMTRCEGSRALSAIVSSSR